MDSFKESRKREWGGGGNIALFFNSSENFYREQSKPTAATGGREIIGQRLLRPIRVTGKYQPGAGGVMGRLEEAAKPRSEL